MEIRQLGDELFHVDGRTGKTNLTVAFINFANAIINDMTNVDISRKPGNLAVGYKRVLTDKLCALS